MSLAREEDVHVSRIREIGDTPEFLVGGGDMGARMRARDWSATPLGVPETWPQSLRTVVRILLTSRYQMWMGWGEALSFFYNDAYRSHSGFIGSTFRLWEAPKCRVDHKAVW
jgi:hypothetical protein